MERKKIQHIIKLSQNENPYGPSPLAMMAVREHSEQMSTYPEPHSQTLKEEIARSLGLDVGQIFVSAGLVESLDILIRNFIEEGENLIIPEVSFVAYKLLANVFGKEVRLAAMSDYSVNIDNILSLVDEKTRVILIANPNNPTGTMITHQDLLKILNNVSPKILVVMDEAYCEYCHHPDYPQSLSLLEKYPNLVIMRTFSKIYGLAGLRVGYTIGQPDLMYRFDYFQAPFTVNQLGAIAATAAVQDQEFVNMSTSSNLLCRQKLHQKLLEFGFTAIPSESNFIFIVFPDQEERDRVFDQLNRRQVMVRKTDLFGEPNGFRITIGTESMNEAVIQCLSEISLTKNHE